MELIKYVQLKKDYHDEQDNKMSRVIFIVCKLRITKIRILKLRGKHYLTVTLGNLKM